MDEDVADALLFESQARDDDIIAVQRSLVFQIHPGHHSIRALLVHLSETQSAGFQKPVTRVLRVVEIVGVVNNALDVALIVAHLQTGLKDIIVVHRMGYLFLS